ncbi:VWA domain-containing protein [Spirochaetia bacterium 38H-sp]|uniref:VWA domain-containing protein n=1 Tax=Rarispira pelagica TaxID=3141764 RepID=A0ABU9UBL8_9SPIR
MKKTIIAVFILLCITALNAQNISITQIDTSSLLLSQTVRAYIFADNLPGGRILDTKDLIVSESADNNTWQKVPVRKVERDINRKEGISFYLLLDNSGSMWDNLAGEKTDNPDDFRITHAKKAIRDFLPLLSQKDRISLATFNRRYNLLQPITENPANIQTALELIKKPDKEEAYTELYMAAEEAIEKFPVETGRRALIILSDGENFPPAGSGSHTNPDYAIELARKKGITCYVVHFGTEKDPLIHELAYQSGGTVFDAHNATELASIYTTIQEQILQEYAISYYASMQPGEQRYVRIELAGTDKEAQQSYYTGTILRSRTSVSIWHYLLLIIPAALWIALILFRLEKETDTAGLRLLYGAPGTKTKMFPVSEGRTIVGGDATADITLSGNPNMRPQAATIVFDPNKKKYVVEADTDLTINNQPATKKELKPGDVLNISGTVVVFDAPEEKDKKKK